MYLVYKHTSPSGKSYIGLTSDYDYRCSTHQQASSPCKAFYAAIQKYGWDNFTHEILYDELTLEQANYREQQAINEYGSMVPYGYNLQSGGRACTMSDVTRARMAIAQTGKKRTFSKAARQKMSDAHVGKPCREELKQLNSERMSGQALPQSTKDKISAAMKGKPKMLKTCEHCGLTGSYTNINRWHNNNCKHKISAD